MNLADLPENCVRLCDYQRPEERSASTERLQAKLVSQANDILSEARMGGPITIPVDYDPRYWPGNDPA